MVKKLLVTTTLATLATTAAHAQEERDWELSLGLTGGVVPEYSGSTGSNAVLFPLVVGEYKFNEQHKMLFNPYDGLSYAYKASENLSVGINADYRRGRDSADSTQLAGMKDIDDTVEIGPWIKYKAGNFSYTANLGIDTLDGYNGFTVDLGIKYDIPLASEDWKADIGANLLYGNDNYAMTYYGVSAAEANGSRAQYEPGSGFHEATISASLTHFLDKNTFVRGDVGYKRLIGDAQNSPLSKQDNQFLGFISVGYKF